MTRNNLPQIPTLINYGGRDMGRVKGNYRMAKTKAKTKQILGTMEDSSSKSPLPDDSVHKDEQKQIDESYASSISTDYPEEVSSENETDTDSDDAKYESGDSDRDDAKRPTWDGKVDGKYVGAFASLNNYVYKKPTYSFFSEFTYNSEDETTSSDSDSENILKKPTGDSWKKSWPKEAKTVESAWVNVYSYYDKVSGFGGYAVILRNMSAQPIAARTIFSPNGKFFLSQVLDGLLDGLCLASGHGCSSPKVRCNSRIVALLLERIAHGCNCEGNNMIGNICQKCANIVPSLSDHCFKTVVPPIEKIRTRNYSKLECVSKGMNRAAHYLAKMSLKEAKKKKRLRGCSDYLKPNEFSEELVSILLNDAYNSVNYNVDAWKKLRR